MGLIMIFDISDPLGYMYLGVETKIYMYSSM